MSYFDAFTANLFREDAEHRRVLAPFGRRGRVYLVGDAEAERISDIVRRLYKWMMIVVIASTIALGWRWTIVIGVAWLVLFYASLWMLVRRLPVVSPTGAMLPRVTRADAQVKVARAIGRRWTIALLVGSLALTAGGVLMIVTTGASIAAIASTAYFAACTGIFAYWLRKAPRS